MIDYKKQRKVLVRKIIITFILLILVVSTPAVAGFLDDYVQKEPDIYRWEKINEQRYDSGSMQFIEFTSQKWQDMNWSHRLRLVIPDTDQNINTALLFITGSGSGREELKIMQAIVKNTGIIGAVLHDVPNQPLFGGKKEDEIIAYTFRKYMETKDKTWPLLVPMATTAVRAMDVIQEYFNGDRDINIDRFIVTGASKRGWTTWLTAAIDNRVQGIIPMVYDNLNLPQQMKHQVEMWGKYSSKIHDYTEMNFPDMVSRGEGRDLVEIVDPYVYRENITQPKLIVIGTNDGYWPLDALNIYYNDLYGKKYIYYAPNDGHGLDNNRKSIISSISGFILAVKGEIPFPKIECDVKEVDRGIKMDVKTDIKAKTIRFWGASSSSTDFRNAEWSTLMNKENTETAEYIFEKHDNGYISGFAEVEYEILGKSYSYCTNVFLNK